jgi:hypothetical protein
MLDFETILVLDPSVKHITNTQKQQPTRKTTPLQNKIKSWMVITYSEK